MKISETGQKKELRWFDLELLQLRLDASRSFRDRLVWLEEMTRLADESSKNRGLISLSANSFVRFDAK